MSDCASVKSECLAYVLCVLAHWLSGYQRFFCGLNFAAHAIRTHRASFQPSHERILLFFLLRAIVCELSDSYADLRTHYATASNGRHKDTPQSAWGITYEKSI